MKVVSCMGVDYFKAGLTSITHAVIGQDSVGNTRNW